jgi:hypothetical protein
MVGVKRFSEGILINKVFEDPIVAKRRLFRLMHKCSKEFKLLYSKDILEKLYSAYIKHMSEVCDTDKNTRYPLLIPIEPIDNYITLEIEDFMEDKSIRRAATFLDGYSIASYDSSWHSGGAHFLVDYLVINIGYFYFNYGKGVGGGGVYPNIYIGKMEDIDPDILNKEEEGRLALSLVGELTGEAKVIFLDESLNLIYTISWEARKRDKYVDIIKEYLNILVDEAIWPVGVFYTRAYDVIRSIEHVSGMKFEVDVQDKHFFNSILRVGERTPLFKVYNPILSKYGLDIVCFYVKVGGGNILRVEFPAKIVEHDGAVDVIHNSIFLQAYLGNGYPYSLIRAHEYAVLSYSDREELEGVIGRSLNIPYEYLYSRKYVSKWRSIS